MPRAKNPAHTATRKNRTGALAPEEVANYRHPEASALARPEIGAQAHFRKSKPPATYRYDSALAPELNWDGNNPAREEGEAVLRQLEEEVSGFQFPVSSEPPTPEQWRALLRQLETRNSKLETALARLRSLSRPFLDWSGKAERLSFDVPTLPLFVHERLSTRAILETLKSHKRDKQIGLFDDLFGVEERDLSDQVLRAYEHPDKWVNRMILGDSLVAMNSLLRYENLGGQVQMIYIDPPYGVKFGSNFQPFVRRRDVGHNDDEDFTREPEMVQAYRDTWELGLHSYLTYLRDRLLLARELLHPSGSVFVQISDENLHHVREVMDEVFGGENSCAVIAFRTAGSFATNELSRNTDFLLWYARDKSRVKYRQLYVQRTLADDVGQRYTRIELPDGTRRVMTTEERTSPTLIPTGARVYRHDNLTSQGVSPNTTVSFEFDGRSFHPGKSSHWKTSVEGLRKLLNAHRLAAPTANSLSYVRYLDDFGFSEIANVWLDTQTGAFTDEKIYAVQTNTKVIERCLLMTTDPGDLVLDPTCGSGTTAYVAEQWGRRWITIDTSRVPLALARQRLLTATFDYYELKDEARGPAGGFVYKRRQNNKGEEVGGIVPHVTLKSIANDEPPAEEVLVDRPEVVRSITRVTGPFGFEATIATAEGLDTEPETPGIQGEKYQTYVQRMTEVLKRAPVLRLPGNETLTLKQIRPPAKTLALSAEAVVEFRVSSFEFPAGGGDGARISGADGLAESDGPRGGDLSAERRFPAGGDIRSDQPDAKGGRVGSQQRGGGARAAESGRIPAVSRAGEGVAARTVDPGGTGAKAGIPEGTRSDGIGDESAGSAENAECPDLETRNLKLETAPVAILFGPENGPISERLVREAWDEAGLKRYTRLFVIGFGIDPKAREFVDKAGKIGIPAVYLQATMDLQMGDLLKNMRSSQVFSVCGLPDVVLRRAEERDTWEAELLGLDTFDPATMDALHVSGDEVPAWFLDTDYNGMVFRVRQAFFPRTGAWENLKKALKAEFEDSVWAHLAGTVSAPFAAGEHGQIAVKVIDPRGNELMVVKRLENRR